MTGYKDKLCALEREETLFKMDLKRVFQGLLCICVFVTINSTSDVVKVRNKKHRPRPRPRPCRCKKLFKDINDVIDTKFKALEERFLVRSPLPLNEQIVNDSLSLQEMNSKMSVLYRNIQDTEEVLRRESLALTQVKEHLQSQSDRVGSLTESFGALEAIVRNLTQVVEHLGVISSTTTVTLSNAIMDHTTPTPETPTTHAPHQPDIMSDGSPLPLSVPRRE